MRRGFVALVLAAGKGTRFKSKTAKVLHPLMGKSMLRLVLDSVKAVKPQKTAVVVGYQKGGIVSTLSGEAFDFIRQESQLGTAHAVLAAKNFLRKEKGGDVLVLNADLPLVTPSTLKTLLALHIKQKNSLTLLSGKLENGAGYGRIIRSGDGGIRIVEERDATPSERKIKEVNGGIYVFKIKDLLAALPKISPLNKKGEYYLTDIVGVMSQSGKKVAVYPAKRPDEIFSVNTRQDLARAAGILRQRKNQELSMKGITILDPLTTWIDLDVRIGRDTVIHSSVIIEGNSRIGGHCRLYPFVHLINTQVGNRVKILSSTVIQDSILQDDAQVGPFAHLRPKNVLRPGSRVGNFVEMKNTDFGRRSKAGHLTYLGDCQVKEDVNIGAGTITCNYDGVKKSKTHIEAGAFIGSGTELVAPVRIGKGAYVGAGSTITKNVSPGSLAISRGRQLERPGWASRKRRK